MTLDILYTSAHKFKAMLTPCIRRVTFRNCILSIDMSALRALEETSNPLAVRSSMSALDFSWSNCAKVSLYSDAFKVNASMFVF
jgi:hypothetical protein